MGKWKKHTLRLKSGHKWRARPGYQVCVMGRGALRFDFPQGWIMEPGTPSFRFYDGAPPDDDIRLEVSYNQIPPIDWSKLPLSELLESVVADDFRKLVARGEIRRVQRDNLRLVWRESSFTDPVEKREARSRICIGIGAGVQALITMEYWPEDAGRATPVWDEALRTLQLEHYVDDPTRGTTAGLN